MKLKSIIAALMALFIVSGCNSQTVKNTGNMKEGSGLANCVSDVKKAFPKANVQKGFSMYGHEVRTEKAKVEKWIKSL